jgi:HEPN domain-containing protein
MARPQTEAYPREWQKKAEADYRRVGLRLREGDVEDAAVHLQQALEKFLKAFLLARGWSLKKTHDLEALLDDAVRYEPGLEVWRKLVAGVTGYYLPARYPSLGRNPSRVEVKGSADRAKDLVAFLRHL